MGLLLSTGSFSIKRISCAAVFAFLLTITLCYGTADSDMMDPNEDSINELKITSGNDIQEAIDSIADGGRLILSEGVYNTLASVILDGRRDLTIEGCGEVWIDTKGIDHHVFTLTNCENITLCNIKAQHVILDENDGAPIDDPIDGAVVGIIKCSDISLMECELVGCGIYGVFADSTTPILLERCYLHDNSKSALILTTGVIPVTAVIRDCIITGNADSIQVQGDVTVCREGNNRIERNSPDDYGR